MPSCRHRTTLRPGPGRNPRHFLPGPPKFRGTGQKRAAVPGRWPGGPGPWRPSPRLPSPASSSSGRRTTMPDSTPRPRPSSPSLQPPFPPHPQNRLSTRTDSRIPTFRPQIKPHLRTNSKKSTVCPQNKPKMRTRLRPPRRHSPARPANLPPHPQNRLSTRTDSRKPTFRPQIKPHLRTYSKKSTVCPQNKPKMRTRLRPPRRHSPARPANLPPHPQNRLSTRTDSRKPTFRPQIKPHLRTYSKKSTV